MIRTMPGACFLSCVLVTSLFAISLANGFVPQQNLSYQNRGDRYEGKRGVPVSDKVELISALIASGNVSYTSLPERFRIKFFLPRQTNVFATVREIKNRENYWMDRIHPSSSWRSSFDNEFTWPTSEVIRYLNNVRLSDLGAVIQLDENTPSNDMTVAPAILFHDRAPRTAAEYSFAFRISRKADVTCTISEDAPNSNPIFETSLQGMLGNLPRSVSWKPASAKDGMYRLRIKVVYRNNGEEVNQIVRFYHHASIN